MPAYRETTGIFSDSTDRSTDADSIVTAMMLGLFREIVGRKRQLILSVGSGADATSDLRSLQSATTKLNDALKKLDIKNLPDIKTAVARPWSPGQYITGKLHGEGLPARLLRDKIVIDDGIHDIRDETAPELYTGRGAYTGVLQVEGETQYWGSTFRHNIGSDSGRWIPKSQREWGYIGGALTPSTTKWQQPSPGRLVGYTHGMIQAIYASAAFGFKGKTVEVAVGEDTTKMASCFGCTTFMYATGRPPDAIHLGKAESWAPAYSDNAFCMNFFRDQMPTKESEKAGDAMDYLNKKWAEHCASWLDWGSRLSTDHVSEGHRKSWEALKKYVTANRKKESTLANLFLDALTCHKSDWQRAFDTLK